MTRQKKIFILCAIVFILLLLYASYDIGSRTTFPGAKPQLKERILDDHHTSRDSVQDSSNKKNNNKTE